MNRNINLNPTMQLLEKLKNEILLVFLIIVISIFQKSSVIYFLEILVVLIITSEIMKSQFPHLKITLSKDKNDRILEYMLSAIFSFFIFITIEFLMNRLYLYTFYAFICLLVFCGGVFYLVIKQ